MSTAYFRGEFKPLEEIHVSPLDRGHLFGDGVYEVIPVYAGALCRSREHLIRLESSLSPWKRVHDAFQDLKQSLVAGAVG